MPPEDNTPAVAVVDAPAAPAIVEPAVAPSTPASDVPAVVEPVVEAAPAPVADPAVEAGEAEPAVTTHAEQQPGLLGQEAKPEDKPTEDKPSEPVTTEPAAIVYEAPTLPDGVTLDSERLGKFDDVIRPLGITAEGRQQLIDMYVAERQADAANTYQAQHDAFAAMKGDWMRSAQADPEIGGSAMQTSIQVADRMIRLFTTDATRPKFLEMLRATGTDAHPEMVRFLVNMAKKFDEPAVAPIPHRPPPDLGRKPANGAMRTRDFYDNPRSQEVMGTGRPS